MKRNLTFLLVAALAVLGITARVQAQNEAQIIGGIFDVIGRGIDAANNANNNNNGGGYQGPVSPGSGLFGPNNSQYDYDYDYGGYNNGYNNNYNNNGYNNGYNNNYNNTYTRPNLVNGHTPNQWYKHPTSGRHYYYNTNGQLYWEQVTAAATTTAATAEQPAANYAPEVVIVEPKPNKIAAKCKPATAADLKRLAKRLEDAQEEHLATIEEELESYRISSAALIPEMQQAGATSEDQAAFLQAIRAGRGDDAQILGSRIFGDVLKGEELGNKVALNKWCKDLLDDVEAGEVSTRKLREGRELFVKLEVPAAARKELQAACEELEANAKLVALLEDLKPLRSGHELPGSFIVIRTPDVTETLVLGGGYVLANGAAEDVVIEDATVADVMNWPLCSGEPCGPATQKWVAEGVLLLGPDNDSVTYTVDGKSATMKAGYQHPLTGDTQRVVSYDPGNGQIKKNTIGAGTYKFMPAQGLWQLYKQSCKVELNNRENPNDFHCVVDNQHVVVKAGDAKAWESAYPIHLKYDRGDGQHPHEARLASGTYVVALNANENLWDLYPQAEYASGE